VGKKGKNAAKENKIPRESLKWQVLNHRISVKNDTIFQQNTSIVLLVNFSCRIFIKVSLHIHWFSN